MPDTRTQVHRQIGVKTPLEEDVLLLQKFTLEESLGRLFELRLELVSERLDVPFDDLVGESVSVRLDLGPDDVRWFHGYVSRFAQTGRIGRVSHYEATVVPWLWFLTRTADCRIFQEKTVPTIIEEVFKDLGFDDYTVNLSSTYRQWAYCVQYRETDFQFVSRLMEQEGIYYYFEHEEDKHTLVLVDEPGAHVAVSGFEELPFRQPDDEAFSDRDYISQWIVERRVQPGAYALNDFDFTATRKALLVKSTHTRSHARSDYEIYDFPGEFDEYGSAESYARVRLEELQSQHETIAAETNCRGLHTGCKFTLFDHPRQDQNGEYIVAAARYAASTDPYDTSSDVIDVSYSCALTVVPAEEVFRPTRTTPWPLIRGPQTAIVVGPEGEEIWTDQYGRVKVQFHWDRYGKYDENSSCWVRVAQAWAGTEWGAMFIPRIGQEVIIEFLEGDPDRPIITGRVYNGQSMPPYPLPDQKTQSGIKSRSTKDGTAEHFNEIRFEDKKGEEQLSIHAEKDHDIVVENDKTLDVGRDESDTVGRDRTRAVGRDEQISIGRNQKEAVDKHQTVTVGKDATLEAGNQIRLVVGKSSISMNKDGLIIIDGKELYINGKSIDLRAEDTYSYAAKNVSVTATMSHQLKGAIIRHNC